MPSPSYEDNALRRSAWNGPRHEDTGAGITRLSIPTATRLVQLYFEYVHDKFHSLFHQPTVLQELSLGLFPDVLLMGLVALSARFSKDPHFENIDPKQRGEPFARECQSLINLREVSLCTIQACVLLGAYSISEGEAEAESVYYAAACRMAQLLDLPNRRIGTALEGEINLRVWWTLRMIDAWSSAGVSLPLSLPGIISADIDGPLPMDEDAFLNLTSQDGQETVITHGPPSSLLAQMIYLNRILVEINEVNSRSVTENLSPAYIESLVLSTERKLDSWHRTLPLDMHDTPQNLAHYARQGLGSLFVAVYLGYYHYGQLLYYQFLHADTNTDTHAPTNAHFYAERCRTSASNLCTILYAANATPGCEMLHTMLGHVLVVASTVQIHTLLFDASGERIAMARTRLERNFEVLTRLRKFWPTLDVVFTRLRAFHKACHTAREGPFRMDHWMLRFLSEFARPVTDRDVDETPSPGLLMI